MIRSGDNRINYSSANNETGSLAAGKPVGYCCGEFLLPEQIQLPLNDFGISHGILLSEQLRTFGGIPRLQNRHLHRLESGARSLAIPVSISEVRKTVHSLVDHNFPLSNPGHDLRISILVTPGVPEIRASTLVVTTSVLPFAQFAREYESGIHLVTVDTREIPGDSIPRHIKHRNRIHYWLAEREARLNAPDARPLMFDLHGNICESTTASIAMVRREEGMVAPPEPAILGSISLATSLEMLAQSGYPVVRRPFGLDELRTAEEILWFSSPTCVLPVSKLDGEVAGSGEHPVFTELMTAWSKMAGFNLVRQANSAAFGV